MNLFVGIDPSINSTGICVLHCDEDGNTIAPDSFYIVRGTKLTKKEAKAELECLSNFQYVIYDKVETSTSENNHEFERIKTDNFIKIVNEIYSIVYKEYEKHDIEENPVLNVWICQEGISYGSTLRTKSIFDLAGLNYMIRMKFAIHDNGVTHIIATPGEIKKFGTGVGNASKELIVTVFKTTHPEINLPKVDDIADAYNMASYAKYLFEQENN